MIKPTVLEKALVQAVVQHPFFASILLRRELLTNHAVPTMGVNKAAQIYYNEDFVNKLTPQQCLFGLAHETLHVAWAHFEKLPLGIDNKKANKAMDCVINETLVADGVGEFIEGGMRWPGAQDMLWQDVYKLLPDDEDGGGGLGQDLMDEGELTPEEAKELHEKITQDVAQAVQAARMAGKLSKNIERLVGDIFNPKVHWSEHMAEWMTQMIRSSNYTWKRPNKRLLSQGLYMPSVMKEPKMGTLVVVSDESGSINDKMLQSFGGYFNQMLDQCNPERVILLHVDTEVGKSEEFTAEDYPVEFKQYCGGGTDMTAAFAWCAAEGVEPDCMKSEEFTAEDYPVEFKQYCGGGTDMTAAFAWCAAEGVEPDCMVFLTDMYTPFGEDPGYPVLWAATTDIVAPFGKTIRIEG